jgi:hypothetical protein
MAGDRACMGVPADAFAAYVRGELALSDALRLERHVGDCPSCAACLAHEASFEATLFELGEIVDAELHAPLHRRWLGWATRAAARWRLPSPPAWGSLALASALAFVVCDHAALSGMGRGLLDDASPPPGALALRSHDAAPLDESPPACEEPALMGMASPDGPACLESIAMASFPPESVESVEWLDSVDAFASTAFHDGEDVCRADDGGDLVCADELVSG